MEKCSNCGFKGHELDQCRKQKDIPKKPDHSKKETPPKSTELLSEQGAGMEGTEIKLPEFIPGSGNEDAGHNSITIGQLQLNAPDSSSPGNITLLKSGSSHPQLTKQLEEKGEWQQYSGRKKGASSKPNG